MGGGGRCMMLKIFPLEAGPDWIQVRKNGQLWSAMCHCGVLELVATEKVPPDETGRRVVAWPPILAWFKNSTTPRSHPPQQCFQAYGRGTCGGLKSQRVSTDALASSASGHATTKIQTKAWLVDSTGCIPLGRFCSRESDFLTSLWIKKIYKYFFQDV